MNELLQALILGTVEGLTEFLPISSTGHLIITSYLLGLSGEKIAFFEVFIQLGAILAVVVLYFKRFWGLLFPQPYVRFAGIRGLYYLFLTSFPAALLGLLLHKYIKIYLWSPLTVAIALFIGGILMFIVESTKKRERHVVLDEMTPKLAFGIGLFQCFALFPGFSRSASTIMGGMILGAKRSLAAEYSFIAAVPLMFAATSFDFYNNWSLLELNDLPFFLTGFIVSFTTAIIAIKTFIILMGKMTLRPFAVYRIILALVIYFVLV
ncbi:undecaprenyl-diphosphate phosphatase [Desulfovibrio litoralis]|uniref:Undecaprenyl-diphosphatase n=1 Tax=Desulfovibrio litoralis DSM 11393 TaxID=1121455 RepID=A0A1M7RRP2_9BACT|nr:undecaprenyl-diphosphate phosphatase [Desulfovibrio litoralis]SHN48766.1 Undecaprenyl-diphosphatase [Desulfovibrio litoralis DSM 11393]